jgi:hypothetical protein
MKTKIRKRSRSTQHARLVRNDAVRKNLSTLIRAWDIVDAATRGERLRELISLGCSRRGLATDIGVSATSIRFHLDLTELSPAQTELVRNGGSARDAFIAIQEQRAKSARIERIRQGRETAVVSDQLATILLASVWDLIGGGLRRNPWVSVNRILKCFGWTCRAGCECTAMTNRLRHRPRPYDSNSTP